MAQLSTLTIELEPYLIKEIARLASYEAKGRRAVVREAIVKHIEAMTEMEDLKQLAAEKYLNEQLRFDQLARIVGYDYALEIQTGKRILEESISSAKKDSSSSESRNFVSRAFVNGETPRYVLGLTQPMCKTCDFTVS